MTTAVQFVPAAAPAAVAAFFGHYITLASFLGRARQSVALLFSVARFFIVFIHEVGNKHAGGLFISFANLSATANYAETLLEPVIS